jgi:hypothetical protein
MPIITINSYLYLSKNHPVMSRRAVSLGRRERYPGGRPPLLGHARHTVQASWPLRVAHARDSLLPLSLRSVWLSVQALQPPRVLGLWGPPVPGPKGRLSRRSPFRTQGTETLEPRWPPVACGVVVVLLAGSFRPTPSGAGLRSRRRAVCSLLVTSCACC